MTITLTMIGNAPHVFWSNSSDSQDPHSYITSGKAKHYQFDLFEKSAGGGIEGTEVKPWIRNGGENV
jgi:hypothetical protein